MAGDGIRVYGCTSERVCGCTGVPAFRVCDSEGVGCKGLRAVRCKGGRVCGLRGVWM